MNMEDRASRGKWSEGPWTAAAGEGPAGVYCDSELLVAEVYSGGDAEIMDNARLIAAAPDLYAALTDMFAMMDEGLLVRDTRNDGASGWAVRQLPLLNRLQRAHAAIVKALGHLPAEGGPSKTQEPQ